MTQETEREAFAKAFEAVKEHIRYFKSKPDADAAYNGRIIGMEDALAEFRPVMKMIEQARARVGKGEVERDSISAEEIKGWRLDPKVHDAILNRADPFSVAWHQREKEHQAALSAKAKPIEVGDEHTDDCAINELGDVCDCGVARNIYPMLGTTDTELTRLKRQVEVLREGLLMVASISNDESRCREARTIFAAADRIAKGEV